MLRIDAVLAIPGGSAGLHLRQRAAHAAREQADVEALRREPVLRRRQQVGQQLASRRRCSMAATRRLRGLSRLLPLDKFPCPRRFCAPPQQGGRRRAWWFHCQDAQRGWPAAHPSVPVRGPDSEALLAAGSVRHSEVFVQHDIVEHDAHRPPPRRGRRARDGRRRHRPAGPRGSPRRRRRTPARNAGTTIRPRRRCVAHAGRLPRRSERGSPPANPPPPPAPHRPARRAAAAAPHRAPPAWWHR